MKQVAPHSYLLIIFFLTWKYLEPQVKQYPIGQTMECSGEGPFGARELK